MRRNPAKGRIHPKISTMPRQQSESAAFLDIYKLVIEKKRLQQELQSMDQRRQQILDRLTILEHQITELEKVAHHLREEPISAASAAPHQPTAPYTDATLETFFLEY